MARAGSDEAAAAGDSPASRTEAGSSARDDEPARRALLERLGDAAGRLSDDDLAALIDLAVRLAGDPNDPRDATNR
jgi:hypothetical protein